jgi:AcrR family transcriptional regulator
MTSNRHTEVRSADDALLDAAREAILAVGWRRTTLTDVARRAGVSRMTLYRRWPDMQTLLADLMTREWSDIAIAPGDGPARGRIATGVAATVAALRDNALFAKILHVDPELLLPYLLDLLAARIGEGQADGSVREGAPTLLARSVLLAAHGFALSARTMTGDAGPSVADLDGELAGLIDRYLAP